MKKRKIRRVIASAMALLMMINALPVTDGWFHPMTSYASTARVNATSLNVRSGPGTTYSIAGKLTNGKTVTVLDRQLVRMERHGVRSVSQELVVPKLQGMCFQHI